MKPFGVICIWIGLLFLEAPSVRPHGIWLAVFGTGWLTAVLAGEIRNRNK